jgi:hypothetical protein
LKSRASFSKRLGAPGESRGGTRRRGHLAVWWATTSTAPRICRACATSIVRNTGRIGKLGEPSLEPLNPLVGQQLLYESAANSFYHALFVQASPAASRDRLSFNAHYTFAKSIDEITDIQFMPHDSLNTRRDRGSFSTFDQRHRFVASGLVPTSARGLARFPRSSPPPADAPSTSSPASTSTRAGRPARAATSAPGRDFFSADLRLSREFFLEPPPRVPPPRTDRPKPSISRTAPTSSA